MVKRSVLGVVSWLGKSGIGHTALVGNAFTSFNPGQRLLRQFPSCQKREQDWRLPEQAENCLIPFTAPARRVP